METAPPFAVGPIDVQNMPNWGKKTNGGDLPSRAEVSDRQCRMEERTQMRVGLAADHWGVELKGRLSTALTEAGHEVVDYGAYEQTPGDDFPDYVIPLARAVAVGKVERGVAVCGSGVGACVAANKVAGVRAALVTDVFSARQGVEDDHMNLICLGSRVVGGALAWELVKTFLGARYSGAERFERRLAKIAALETPAPDPV
jgi:ribose 5-phosphate isomerase B